MTFRSIYAKPLTDAERERYRRFVASLPCANCDLEGFSQCAHYSGVSSSRLGKGMGRKAHDLMTMPLCHEGANGCHAAYDRHELPDDDAPLWAMLRIGQTIIAAANAGVLKVK